MGDGSALHPPASMHHTYVLTIVSPSAALLAAHGAQALTIGDFAAGLCPDAQARLGQNEVLLAVAQSSRDFEIGGEWPSRPPSLFKLQT